MIAQGARKTFLNRVTKEVMNHALFSKNVRARYVIGVDGWVAYFLLGLFSCIIGSIFWLLCFRIEYMKMFHILETTNENNLSRLRMEIS